MNGLQRWKSETCNKLCTHEKLFIKQALNFVAPFVEIFKSMTICPTRALQLAYATNVNKFNKACMALCFLLSIE
jgi:hypothetical protein